MMRSPPVFTAIKNCDNDTGTTVPITGSSEMPTTPISNDRTNGDIRAFMSPPPSLQRRRRIIESSSSDEQNAEPQAGHQDDAQPQLQRPNATNDENAPPAPIQISDSDSESSDSMYIARPQPAGSVREPSRRPAPQRQLRSTPPRQRRRQETPQRSQNVRRLREAEAESTSAEESAGLSADESDPNAADLYRAAILGVRNRPNAAQQVSSVPHQCQPHTLTAEV